MSEGMKQDNAQENPSNAVENKPDSPSNDGLLPEIMAKKEKIKSLEAELAKRDANDEKRRVSKLEQEGKYQEVIAEKNKTIESLNGRLESQTSIVSDYKANLINNLTNDESRKEELATKSVDFLQELNKEKQLLQNSQTSNPDVSLGQVRKTAPIKSYSEMTEAEKRAHFESL